MKKSILLLLTLATSLCLSGQKPALNGLQKKVLKENSSTINKIITDKDYVGYEDQVEVLCLIAKEYCNIEVKPIKEYLAVADTANLIFKNNVVFKEWTNLNKKTYKKFIARKDPADVVKAMKALKLLKID